MQADEPVVLPKIEFYEYVCKKCRQEVKSPKGAKPDCMGGGEWKPLTNCHICEGELIVLDEPVVVSDPWAHVSIADVFADAREALQADEPEVVSEMWKIKDSENESEFIDGKPNLHKMAYEACKQYVKDNPDKPLFGTIPEGVDISTHYMMKNGQSYVWRDGQWKPELEKAEDKNEQRGDLAYELPTGHKVYHQFTATVTRNGGSIKVGCSDLSSMPRLMSEAWEAMGPNSSIAYFIDKNGKTFVPPTAEQSMVNEANAQNSR